MFFNDAIRRRLSSLLQPWLQEEPDLELKLGFLRSHLSAKNLRFDVSALSQLLDESTCLTFKDVRVENLSIKISNWSVPAFTVEAHGVHVTLTAREPVAERCSRKMQNSTDSSTKEMKDILSVIDPEGSALHDIIGSISGITSVKNWLTTSLMNVAFEHCRLQMHDIHLQVKLPVTGDFFACLSMIKELNLEARHLKHACLLRRLVGALFVPKKESSLVLNGRGLEIGLKGKDHINCVLSSSDIFTFFRLKDLQLLDFNLCAPELKFSFSPVDLSILLAFDMLSSEGVKHARNGRELWNIASKRIGCLTSNPRVSLRKLVDVVRLWIRYVHAYECLLLLVGYSAETLLKRSVIRMSCEKKFSRSVKHQWKVISETEKELPVEAIARARNIARYRATLNVQCTEDIYSKSLLNFCTKFFLKILSGIAFVWKIMCCIFYPIIHLFFRRKILDKHQELDGPLRVVCEDSCSLFNFSLNLGKLSIDVSPINAVRGHVSGKSESHIGTYYLDLLSFCLVIDALFLFYTADHSAQSLSLSCGDLKVFSSSSLAFPPMGGNLKKDTYHSFKEHITGKVNDSRAILWSEPSQQFLLSEDVVTGSANYTERACVPLLEKCLQEMWSNWKRTSKKLEGSKTRYSENPFILCEIKSFLMDPCLKRPDCGLWKCSSTVGKLNFDLGYSSIISIALLLRQIQNALSWKASNGRPRVFSHSSSTTVDPLEIKWANRYKSYGTRMKMAMLKMIPEKNIQVGVLIAGPIIRIALPKEGLHRGKESVSRNVAQGDFYLDFDVHNIELSVWPTSKADLAALTGDSRLDDARPEYLLPKKPRLIDVPKSDMNENYLSQGRISLDYCLRINGLDAYFECLEENQRCQVVVSKSITIQLSSFRQYLHSFTTTVVTLSAALCGMATGVTVLLYMDELSVFFQVIIGILSAVSHAFTSGDSTGGVYFRELIRRDMASTKPDTDRQSLASEVKGASLILKSTQFVIDATVELKSVDIIMHNSRKNDSMDNCMESYGAFNNKNLESQLPEYGIWISFRQSCIQVSCEEEQAEVCTDLSGIEYVIFRYQSQIGECTDQFELRNLLHQSHNCLYEMSVSNCTINLWADSHQNASSSGQVSNAVYGSTSDSKTSYAMESPPSTMFTEGSNVHFCGFNEKLGRRQLITSNIVAPASSYWLLINISLGEIIIAERSTKNVLTGVHQPKKLLSSLFIGGEFQTISWEIQGGLFFLETTALAMLVRCFGVYVKCITNLSSIIPSLVHISSGKKSETTEPSEGLDRAGNHRIKEYAQGSVSLVSPSETCNASNKARWELFDALTIGMSQFSLVLVVSDESGGVRELVIEADFHLNLETNIRTFIFDLSRLTICSQHLNKSCAEQTTNEIQIPHFSSVTLNDLSSCSVSGDPTLAFGHTDRIHTVLDDACPSSSPVFKKESSVGNVVKESLVENVVPRVSHLNHRNNILKHVGASIKVEKPVTGDEVGPLCLLDWVGSGSISGFDLTISLSEIQMLLSLVAPLSGIFSEETTGSLKQRQWSRNQASDDGSEDTVRDGSIIAVQDIHQHMYFAVEAVENKYRLVGTIHYSLAGERALFRVKYQNQRRWRSPVSWFSLISLHAKSDSGEPLRLNYHPGSGFVDISSTNDSGWALWRTLPYKPESYEGDNDPEPYNQSARNTFHFVNKKSDCSVAFVDGVPEFVRKPGNPFKLKVFPDLPRAREVVRLGTYSGEACGTYLQRNSHVDKERTSGQASPLPYIDITIDKVTVTIVHELSDTSDKFPLLRGCLDNIQFILQILFSKVRVISTFTAVIYDIDTQRNLWKEIVHPVEMCIFYRSRFALQGTEIGPQGVPLHFYFRIKELDISLTELSLDILLFLVGKLDLAGPFAVKSPMIFANCCKVENHSGLSLHCQFYDNQDTIIARKQSATIFLRHLALADRPPENTYFVSVQLAVLGAFLTSPIRLSLLEARVLAWRTRIVSLQGSRTFPGPFIVVDISRKTEDGLSIVVSPLLRIHNESGFSMELRFRRPQQEEAESASVLLRTGDTIDDSMAAFDATSVSGGLKKALLSLSLGNFLFSFRPEITEYFGNSGKPISVEWSDDLKGGKAVRLSGIFDKLSYRMRKAFGVKSMKYSFSTAHCSLYSEDAHFTKIHFLIQSIGRDCPVIKPDNFGDTPETKNSPVAIQEQKEIFLLPTVQVSNLLQSEIHVLLTETHPDLHSTIVSNNIGKQATIPCGSTADLYANPAIIYFTVTLTAFNSSCKPVNSGDWVKKLQKLIDDIHYLDIDLDFGGGKYFASLRLSCGHRGILEATVFTSYMLQNDTDLALFCFASNQKPLSREEADKFSSSLPPELGSFLPPNSTRSWFLKSNKVRLKLLEEKAFETLLDLDVLSGFTEISLAVEERAGVKRITKLGVSLKPSLTKVVVPSQIVSMVPRYVVFNESQEVIIVRQCYLEDDMDGMLAINTKQKEALQLQTGTSKIREISLLDSLLRKHRNNNEDLLLFVQFRLNEIGWDWSGPICIASLGRFFLKFRRSLDSLGNQSNHITAEENKLTEFAVVHVVEEGPTLVLHFHRPPNSNLPYRIENYLHDASITYYQKDALQPEILGSGNSADFVWDDLNLPHKLVVQINGTHLLREINIDKVRAWKPLFKVRQHKGLAFHLPLDKKSEDQRTNFDESNGVGMAKVGYEVYADGPTRVLRICELSASFKGETEFQPCAKVQLRVSHFAIHLLEIGKQDVDATEQSIYSPIIVARLGNINLDSMFTDQRKYNQFRVQSLNVDEKWVGAPFAAMLRRNQLEYYDTNENVLHIVFVLLSTNSNVKQVKYSSIVLQPIDLNLDEETLMRLVPFWRTSLSDSNTQSKQFYFEHFEIHPIKIVASFLPGDSYSSYSSAQETLRSLLHSVIKIPAVKNVVVELNGVLVTHALITVRELFIKCAQHYSWYAMRAIYIAKGSPLLPPAFASIFDDSASSSLDIFFDPSSGSVNLPGLTLGTFKFISKCIDRKGFSGTKRYFGDLGKTMKTAGSNVLFAAVTEISDCVLKGAETSGFNGVVKGFHQGILKLAMEPSLLGTAVMEGGPDRKIKLDRSPGIDELYIEGYLQAMLDTIYKQEYLRVRVVDNQVFLKNLPPNSSLIAEIMDRVRSFLASKALLKGDPSISRPLRHLRGESEWKIGPTVLTLCEHLFVSFAIRMLRKQAGKLISSIKWKEKSGDDDGKAIIPAPVKEKQEAKLSRSWGIGKFVLSGMLAYIDGRLCRFIPNTVARRIVSGFLLSFLDKNDTG